MNKPDLLKIIMQKARDKKRPQQRYLGLYALPWSSGLVLYTLATFSGLGESAIMIHLQIVKHFPILAF